MEKLEIKKSIERSKAMVIALMVFLVLLTPSIIHSLTVKKIATVLTLIVLLVSALYKRVRRLNYKLSLLTK